MDIKLNSFSIKRNNNFILNDINLHLKEKRIAIIGQNGSGKTSLLKALNGLITPDIGDIYINNLLLNNRTIKGFRKKIGYIFQNADNQLIMPTVFEDLIFGLRRFKIKNEEVNERVKSILKKYNVEYLYNRSIYSLSGGEKQIIALLGVLITSPELILFDEPTTLLDFHRKNHFKKIINNLDKQIIMVTHDMSLISDFSRVIVIVKGEVSFDGSAKDAIHHYLNLPPELHEDIH